MYVFIINYSEGNTHVIYCVNSMYVQLLATSYLEICSSFMKMRWSG